MPDDIFLTKAELARVRGVDRRNKLLEDIEPAGFLLMATKRIPLFRNSPLGIAQLSTAGRTAGPKMPLPQPEPIQPEAIKAK
jgi:hypothetical protein